MIKIKIYQLRKTLPTLCTTKLECLYLVFDKDFEYSLTQNNLNLSQGSLS
jgi:hypothetical protein